MNRCASWKLEKGKQYLNRRSELVTITAVYEIEQCATRLFIGVNHTTEERLTYYETGHYLPHGLQDELDLISEDMPRGAL